MKYVYEVALPPPPILSKFFAFIFCGVSLCNTRVAVGRCGTAICKIAESLQRQANEGERAGFQSQYCVSDTDAMIALTGEKPKTDELSFKDRNK